jgi:diguanylate cyclase (GGDEF)-like protein
MSGTTLAEQLLRRIEAERRRARLRTGSLSRDMVELNVLRAFSAAINDRLDRDQILSAVREHLPHLFDFGVICVLTDFDKPALHVLPRRRVSRGFIRASIQTALSVHSQIRGRPLLEAEVDLHVDRRGASQAPIAAKGDQVMSQVSLPLVSGGENVGLVSMCSARPNAFGALDVQLFSLVSYQLSAALRNSLLLQRTWEQAIRDSLTGMFNRRHFDERLEEEHRRTTRYHHPLSVVMVDVDHFKTINDQHGHPAGDRVLKAISEALVEATRTSDMVFRYGGEEFAVLLPETSIEEAVLVAERIRGLVPRRVRQSAKVAPVTVSLGVAGMGGDIPALSAEGLVGRADGALYLAKQSGRNRVCASVAEGKIRRSAEIAKLEQRRFPRMSATLSLKYLVIPDLSKLDPIGQSVDLSAQGLKLELDRKVPEGAFMMVELADQKSKQPVRMLSKIVWSRPGRDGRTSVGVRIVSFERSHDNRYARMLTKLPSAAAAKKKPRKKKPSR